MEKPLPPTLKQMNKIHIIGIGPGSKEYLLPIARRTIENSDCLIGARRILSLFRNLDKEKIYLDKNFDRIIPYIEKNRSEKKLAILVSGDPGLYSFLGKIQKSFKKDEYSVIPGISVLQLAFAKIGETWEDAKIISLHARAPHSLIEDVRNHSKVFLFTDSKFSPPRIAGYLIARGIENRKAVVFENIGYPDERIVDTDLKTLSKMGGFKLCVMIIKK